MTNKKIPVGGQLVPMTPEKVLADSSNIIDITLHKRQSELNAKIYPETKGNNPETVAGYINTDGNVTTSDSYYCIKYDVKKGDIIKISASHKEAPTKDAIRWAIYSSDTVFDESTLIRKSGQNAKGDYEETVNIETDAFIVIQRFYSLLAYVSYYYSAIEKNTRDITFLSQLLASMVGYRYMGKADTEILPANQKNIFYIADEIGIYTGYGDIEIIDGELAVLRYDGVKWYKDSFRKTADYVDDELFIPVAGIKGENKKGYINNNGIFTDSESYYCTLYKSSKKQYIYIISATHKESPTKNAIRWAIYSSDTIFNESTLIRKSDKNAKGDYEETVVVNEGESLLVQGFYNLKRTTTVKERVLAIKDRQIKNLENRRSNVFIADALLNTGINKDKANMIIDSLLSLEITGLDETKHYIVSHIDHIAYLGGFISVSISAIGEDNTLSLICSISGVIDKSNKCQLLKNVYYANTKAISAKLYIDGSRLSSYLGNNFINISQADESTFRDYGIRPQCIHFLEITQSAIVSSCPNDVLRRELVRIYIDDLDITRKYVLRTLGYAQETGLFTLQIATTENKGNAYLFQTSLNPADAVGIYRVRSGKSYIDVNFDILNDKNRRVAYNDYDPDYRNYGLVIDGGGETIIAEDEMSLTLDNTPMKLQDCGKIDKLFYLTCGNSIYSTNSIIKNKYTASDVGKNLKKVYQFGLAEGENNIEGINALRQINNGNLLINVRIASRNAENQVKYRSSFYIFDGQKCESKVYGNWAYTTLSGGVVRVGGYWTNVWDFSEYNELIFLTERAAQGLGGKAWMSKDGGDTWFLIFNAHPECNGGQYPIMMPSGWDNTDPSKPDFRRPVPGTATYPASNCHIHGITYDPYRNNVIIVSGDATNSKNSYTAIWVCQNPQCAELYPSSEINGKVIPEGGTSEGAKVKMLDCKWRRIGLFGDENPTGKNLQFVSAIAFPDRICFGSDCGGGGVNGVLQVTQPNNIVGSNISVKYPLNPDSENSLTHSASGWIKLPNMPYLWVFHREGSGFHPETSSDQRAAILSSYDGKLWKRVWVDDTLDEDRKTKISWGAAIIGKSDELYLRYKGADVDDNIIRRIIFK